MTMAALSVMTSPLGSTSVGTWPVTFRLNSRSRPGPGFRHHQYLACRRAGHAASLSRVGMRRTQAS
ncbi:hypothetical protein CC56_0484 [Bordetella pertussis H934]|nr:hypothetical protein CC56_0484 [Bordetella pertussis H934]